MHNIATINGRVSMAYTGQTPWHKLGIRMPNTESVEAAIQAANLDWTVEGVPVYLKDGTQVPDTQAIVRPSDSAILGTVGGRYIPIQNREAFEPLQVALTEFGATIESAGALGKGEKVWLLCKLPDTNGHVLPGDKIQPYFLVSTAHDGSAACTARSTPIRVVCQNTLSAALSSDRAALSIRHTASNGQRLAEISTLVERMIGAHHRTVETFKHLAEVKVSIDEVIAYTETLWPVAKTEQQAIVAELLQAPADREFKRSRGDEARDLVLELLKTGKGSEIAGQTAWGAYNACTEYVDHVSVNRKDGQPRVNGARSALFGSGADIKVRALDLAIDTWLGSSRN